MEAEPFEIYPYSIENLKLLLREKSIANIETINKKSHTYYFDSYFDHIVDNGTIVVENNYIDKDFLEDYSEYYVRCFRIYRRRCTRIHFFNVAFAEKEFNSLLKKEESFLTTKILNDNYLGFVIIKPLPQTIIGRTCLKTYGPDRHRRFYPINRTYPVNLFGIELKINSLAFQEQDNVASACATSALWSVFHGSGILFQHHIPSPIEITKTACEKQPLETRYLPNNNGLTLEQMAHAIRDVGLEPYLVNGDAQALLTSNIHAYLIAGLPILLGGFLVDISKIDQEGRIDGYLGHHAVTVTGFSLGGNREPYKNDQDIILRSSRINEIYAHDDQVGPYARMKLDSNDLSCLVDNKTQIVKSLYTSWKDKSGTVGNIRFIPQTLLCPLYHKIRIPFKIILDTIIPFDAYLETLRIKANQHNKLDFIQERIEWSIYLTTNNKLKTEFLNNTDLQISGDLLKNTLVGKKPKYIWRATAFCSGKEVLDLLFDATDIEQGLFMNQAIGYDSELFYYIVDFSKKFLKENGDTIDGWKILQWFSKQNI